MTARVRTQYSCQVDTFGYYTTVAWPNMADGRDVPFRCLLVAFCQVVAAVDNYPQSKRRVGRPSDIYSDINPAHFSKPSPNVARGQCLEGSRQLPTTYTAAVPS